MGATVENLTFPRRLLIQAIAVGVALGTALGVAKIIFQRPMLPLLVDAGRTDEVFRLLYFSAGLDTPHAGMIMMGHAFRGAGVVPLIETESRADWHGSARRSFTLFPCIWRACWLSGTLTCQFQ